MTDQPLTQTIHFKVLVSVLLAIGLFFAGRAIINYEPGESNYATTKGSTVKTESGLKYEVLVEGAGATPKPEDYVTVHYEGKLEDGTVFDSSYKRGEPATFPANGVIPGWVEALSMMTVGSKWELTIPPELGYGEQGAGDDIPPNATLHFVVELLEVQTIDQIIEAFEKAQVEYLEETAKSENFTKTESGLLWGAVEMGDGAKPKGPESEVTVHYSGRLTNGYEFDSSHKRGQPATFKLNGVISGWTEGVQLMPVGSTFVFVIPAELGYGAHGTPSGSIPPNATLIFEIQLLSVND